MLRLLDTNRRGAVRPVLLLIVAAATCFIALAVAAAPTVLARESQRRAEQLPILTTRSNPSHLGYSDALSNYRGLQASLVLVGDPSPKPPLPPGITSIPKPGEAYLSPGLLHLMRRDSNVARWFSGLRVFPLEPAGASTGDQLLAYIGAPTRAFGTTYYVSGFGRPDNRSDSERVEWYQLLGLALLMLLPAIGSFLATARLGMQARRRRARALAVVAAPRRQIAALAVVETALPALIGAIVGLSVFVGISHAATRIPVVDRPLIAGDVQVNPAAAIGIPLALTLIVAFASWRTAWADADLRHTTRVSGIPARATQWMFAVFLVGAAAVALAITQAKPQNPVAALGTVLLALGLPTAVIALIRRIGRLGRYRWPVVAWLSARRLAFDPGPAGAAVAGVAVLGFALFAAQPVLRDQYTTVSWTSLVGRSVLVRSEPLAQSIPVRYSNRFSVDATVSIPAVGLFPPGANENAPPTATALVATCAQLAKLYERQSIDGCTDDATMTTSRRPAAASVRWFIRSLEGANVALAPRPEAEIKLPPSGPVPVQVAAVIPPSQLDVSINSIYVANVYARIPSNSAKIDAYRADLIAAAPGSKLDVPGEEGVQAHDTTRWILLSISIAAMFGIAACIAIGVSKRRDASDRAGRIAGISDLKLRLVSLLATAVAAAVATGLAFAGGLLVGFAYVVPRREALRLGDSYLVISLAMITAGIGLGIFSEFTGRRPQEP